MPLQSLVVRSCVGCAVAIGLVLIFGHLASASEQAREGTIAIITVDKAGEPLGGVQVFAQLKQCKCSECKDPKQCKCCPDQRSAISGDKGTVTLSLAPGLYSVHGVFRDVRSPNVEVAVENDAKKEVRLVLPPPKSANGRE